MIFHSAAVSGAHGSRYVCNLHRGPSARRTFQLERRLGPAKDIFAARLLRCSRSLCVQLFSARAAVHGALLSSSCFSSIVWLFRDVSLSLLLFSVSLCRSPRQRVENRFDLPVTELSLLSSFSFLCVCSPGPPFFAPVFETTFAAFCAQVRRRDGAVRDSSARGACRSNCSVACH